MTESYVREVPLGRIFTAEHVLDEMTNRSKRAAIEELVNLLWKLKLVSNKSEAIERVIEREGLASTALGDGVAIPHARLEVGPRPVIAMGRHPSGIEFDSPDGKPVHLILLILWAPGRAGLFNRLFAGLVSKLADANIRQSLLAARGAKEIAVALSDVYIDMQAGAPTKCEADMLIMLQLLEAKRHAGARGLARQISLARDELPGSILSRFDRLIDRYGEALVEAPEGVCGGCSKQLSSSFSSEILKNSHTIYVCESCGRFLIHHIA